jgi:putative glutamine amidotransferase
MLLWWPFSLSVCLQLVGAQILCGAEWVALPACASAQVSCPETYDSGPHRAGLAAAALQTTSNFRLRQLPTNVTDTLFVECDFSEANLEGVELRRVIFKRCRFDNLKASNSRWVEVECHDCIGRWADFSQSHFTSCTWSGCSLPESTWHASTLTETCFDHARLATTAWSGCRIQTTHWLSCQLLDSMWHQVDAQDCCWTGCDLRESVWWDCRGAGCLIEKSQLQDTSCIESWQPVCKDCQQGCSQRPRIVFPWRTFPRSAYLSDLRQLLRAHGAIVVSSNMQDCRVDSDQLTAEVNEAMARFPGGPSRALWLVNQNSSQVWRVMQTARSFVAQADGVLLPGGSDVEPVLYGATALPSTNPSSSWMRTVHECAMLAAAKERCLSVLGICRGMQLLNVFEGGGLIQHIQPASPLIHRLIATPSCGSFARCLQLGLPCSAPSYQFHHQACGPLASCFQLLLTDGVFPQAIVCSANRRLGVQFHPEVVARLSTDRSLLLGRGLGPPRLTSFKTHPADHLHQLLELAQVPTTAAPLLGQLQQTLIESFVQRAATLRSAPSSNQIDNTNL